MLQSMEFFLCRLECIFATMIQFVKHADINRSLWEECVRSSINGMVNVLPWYLDIAFPNWDALIYKNYEAVMLVPTKAKWGVSFLYHPNFLRQIGIFSKTELDEQKITLFFKAYQQKGLYQSVFLTQKNDNSKPATRVFQSLDLKKDIELNENTKRNIKKAEKLQLVLTENLSAADVFKVYVDNRGQFLEHSERDLQTLHQLMEKGLENGQGKAFGVSNSDGELLTAAYVCLFEKTVYYLIGSVNNVGKKQGAMHWLFAQIMEKYKETYDIFDFGGSNIDSVAQFYKGLGGKDQIYYHYERGMLKPVLKLLKLA